ncbi:hypothetical protein TBLA_0B04750 [Henningerozyma blattae CBS 6284]|uniref:Low-affinity Fe(2+) transport protein n=1 Tax=Henningerozyma blattae (strain ATCC 34711 / CBS 6284 / DSM 70876 / NBRC 10599 / NRRL Y-10934 / UCD 77-7) TaxID=1071380 RepID=I2GYV8_HENB6|nr:hypothetical protein TBLA_0B04750 [Tetrapisispora blattae CBS 6284]CCH59310.1 hypothetical protein TBLA_0B04750 [Tetrapisispora blattae CBS 6284]
MGKFLEFFSNPGQRPAIFHRAPLIAYEGHDINPNLTSSDSNVEDNTVAFVESDDNKEQIQYTVHEKEEHSERVICHSEDEFDDKKSNINVDETMSVSSDSDNTTKNFQIAEVMVHKKGDITSSIGFTGLEKGLTDKTLDKLVYFAGSQAMFILMWTILIIWIVLGGVYRAPDVWQVVMQDGQSIQCYIWDTLLMRQQLMSTHEQVLVCASLRSRLLAFKEFILRRKNSEEQDDETVNEEDMLNLELNESDMAGDIPMETWYDKLATLSSEWQGSLYFIIIYWLGVIVWIACGVIPSNAGNNPPYTGETTGKNPRLQKFSNTWQMYINTATAVALLISSTFLQNIRARHDIFIGRYLSSVYDVDRMIDLKLRNYFNDFHTPNPVIEVPEQKRSWSEKHIDTYADVIGTGFGIIITIVAFAVWVGIGNTLHWDDDWWLIIGTYTGLMGFLDGFVIRNVYFRIMRTEEEQFELVANADVELMELVGITCPEEYRYQEFDRNMKSIGYRISKTMNYFCSTTFSVYVSIAVIVGLICAASGMRWSTMGQLICNTPTMIIEEFFLLVLLQAHNWADKQRRMEVSALLARRKIILNYVERYF